MLYGGQRFTYPYIISEVNAVIEITIWVLRAFIAILVIAVISSTIGSYSVFRGSTFLVSGIAHGALAGAALGVLISIYIVPTEPYFFSIIFALGIALAVGYASKKHESMDVAVGVLFALSMSLAILFLSMIREYSAIAWSLIMGNLLLLSSTDIELMILTAVFLTLIFLLTHRKMLFSIFDPEMAKVSGVNPFKYESLLFVLMAVGIVVLLMGVGAILVYALLVIPAAAARRFFKTVEGTMAGAFAFTAISGFLGIALSLYIDVAPSALVGLIATIIYAFTFLKN